jgi:hypothetical protein
MIIAKKPAPPENWPFVDELKAPKHYSLRWGRTKKEKDEANLGKGVVMYRIIKEIYGYLFY